MTMSRKEVEVANVETKAANRFVLYLIDLTSVALKENRRKAIQMLEKLMATIGY